MYYLVIWRIDLIVPIFVGKRATVAERRDLNTWYSATCLSVNDRTYNFNRTYGSFKYLNFIAEANLAN